MGAAAEGGAAATADGASSAQGESWAELSQRHRPPPRQAVAGTVAVAVAVAVSQVKGGGVGAGEAEDVGMGDDDASGSAERAAEGGPCLAPTRADVAEARACQCSRGAKAEAWCR